MNPNLMAEAFNRQLEGLLEDNGIVKRVVKPSKHRTGPRRIAAAYGQAVTQYRTTSSPIPRTPIPGTPVR
jgi:hypothetical protein